MLTGPPVRVLDVLGLRAPLAVFKDVPEGNASWLAGAPDGGRVVLRRYHAGATPEDLAYEHAVLRHLAAAGWMVPDPIGEPVQLGGRWYCLTRFVPGAAIVVESARQRRRRGADLARLHLALRDLGELTGQRPGWRAQHRGVTARTGVDWDTSVSALTAVSPGLGAWAAAAAADTAAALAAIGADVLPLMVVHGDFAEQNVHYAGGRLAGIIDFGLTHLDSRPYELAMARTHRSPQILDGYRAGLNRAGWPLGDLEEAAIEPLNRAVRVDLAAWHIEHGRATGRYDLTAIERQLARTGTTPP